MQEVDFVLLALSSNSSKSEDADLDNHKGFVNINTNRTYATGTLGYLDLYHEVN